MSKVKYKSNLQYIQQAWVRMLYDFRAWLVPDTPNLHEWKNRPILDEDKEKDKDAPLQGNPIYSCRDRMVDDLESMLLSYRQNTGNKQGMNAILPVILTASATITIPPEAGKRVVVAQPIEEMRNGELVKLRMTQKAVLFQLAFIASTPFDANSLADNFCAYMLDENKRRIPIDFVMREATQDKQAIIETTYSTVYENELMPSDGVISEDNLYACVIDVTLVTPVPVMIFQGENNIDHGVTKGQMPKKENWQPMDEVIKDVQARYLNATNQHEQIAHDHIYYDDEEQRKIIERLKNG